MSSSCGKASAADRAGVHTRHRRPHMRIGYLVIVFALLALTPTAWAQKEQKEEEFLRARPAVGDPLPDVTVYSPDGKEISTANLRGHYTVLTFGCLT